MYKELIKSSSLNDKNIDSAVYDFYTNIDASRKDPGKVGPIVKGVDVGNLRYYDTHTYFPSLDLTKTNIVIKDYPFDGYNARVYYPEGVKDLRPTVFYIHGGAFLFGNVEKCDMPMKRLAELINGVVVSIDYSLSPEVSYPTALEQCYKCLNIMIEDNAKYNIDTNKIAVMGDSAGGNLASALCLKDKNNINIKMQILLYPELDLSRTYVSKLDKSLFGPNIDDYAWNRITDMVGKFNVWDKAYLQHNEDKKDELISPLFAKNVRDFPKTLIFCAQYDYFTLESEEFANKLDDANVDVSYYCFEGSFHGFLEKIGILDQSEAFLKLVASHINKL